MVIDFSNLIYSFFIKLYSVLKLFTGFAIAAFIAWKLTVIKATAIAKIPVAANTPHSTLIRYANDCSQLFIKYHATGDAINNAIAISFRKSLDKSVTILLTE